MIIFRSGNYIIKLKFPKIICRFRYNISNEIIINNRMYRVMYLEGDSISTLKYSMLYLDSDMLFRIRYYIRIHILYLVRTDAPNCWFGNQTGY